MRKTSLLLVSLVVVLALLLAACTPAPTAAPTEAPTEAATEAPATEEPSGEKVQIRWFVGLGVGTNEQERAGQEEVVADFNASQDEIELILEIVDVDTAAYETLATQIAAGNAPDVVGPVGLGGREEFKGAWLDMNPMIDASSYDLTRFDPAMVQFYNVDGEMLGVPFGTYPSFLYVNTDLFDEAGLPYPPQVYGDPYVDEDGNELEWNFDTLRDLAMKLTVDANGNDATSADFDPENIVQWGYDEQWTDARGTGTMFGAGSFNDADNNAQLPPQWLEAWQWLYDARWTDHFVPTGAHLGSEILNMEFASGNIAMVHCHMWFAGCCMGDIDFAWDTGVVPSHNGQTTAKMHADTFEIMRYTEHPAEAFEVVAYLTGPAAEKLTLTYGIMPALLSLQGDWFTTFNEQKFPGMDINWQVVVDSSSYADSPPHEGWMPNYQEAKDRINTFYTLMLNEPDLDLVTESDTLIQDLQVIFDAAAEE